MKYAIFDEKGFPKAFYSPDIHGDNIPKEAIPISDEQWLEFINNQGRRRWDFEKKEVVEYTPSPPSLDELRTIVHNERKAKVASLLSKTDYIITKIQEAQIKGDTSKYEELISYYNSQLQQRDAIRQWNDDLERRIQSATTTEELEQIRQEIANYTPKQS